MSATALRAAEDAITMSARWESREASLRFDGTADLRAKDRIQEFLLEVHGGLCRIPGARAAVDIRGVDFMASSCIKAFVTWLLLIQELPVELHYRVHFTYDPRRLWQKRTLTTLACFAPELVTLSEAGAPAPGMRFRTVLLLVIVGVISAAALSAVVAISVVLEGAATREEARALERGMELFEEDLQHRLERYDSETRVIADEPRLKAAVATEDISRDTLEGVAAEIADAARSDLLIVADAAGLAIASAKHEDLAGVDLAARPPIAGALESGAASAVWVIDDRPLHVVARRLEFGSKVVGVLVAGYVIDGRLLDSAERRTGSGFAIAAGDRALAGVPPSSGAGGDAAGFAGALVEAHPGAREVPTEATIGGERFLVASHPFPGSSPEQRLRYLTGRSLDRALEPARRLALTIGVIALVLIGASFVVARRVARTLSRPLDELVSLTRRVAAGEAGARADVRAALEVTALGAAMNRMAAEIEDARRNLAQKERLEREMEIARNIQTAVLPRAPKVTGLDIATRMFPADEVGGDYYDVREVKDGAWIGIGDVTGHGVPAGLVMLLTHGAIAAVSGEAGERSAKDVILGVNRLMYEAIRKRLGLNDHVTLSVIRYFDEGRLQVAGAHELMLVLRPGQQSCDKIDCPGVWVGVKLEISSATEEISVTLEPDTLIVLHTDGVTEAMNTSHEQFGIDRLAAVVERARDLDVEQISDEVFRAVSAWTSERKDDMSLMVMRYKGLEHARAEGSRSAPSVRNTLYDVAGAGAPSV